MRISKGTKVVKPLTKAGIYDVKIVKSEIKQIDDDLSLFHITIEYISTNNEVEQAHFTIRECYEDYFLRIFADEYDEPMEPVQLVNKLIEDKRTLKFQLTYKGAYVNWLPVKKD
jgi:hypothetical protein